MDVMRQGFVTRRRLIGSSMAAALLAPAFVRRAGAQDQVSIRLMTSFASPEERASYEELVATFEGLFPNIDVQYEPVPSDYDTKLLTDLAAGNAADVFVFNDLLAPDLMSRGVLQPIDELMAGSEVAVDDFYPDLVANFQLEGQTYALPKDFSTLAMVYDPVAFEAAGIAAPPTNWDELRAAGEALMTLIRPPSSSGRTLTATWPSSSGPAAA